MISLMAGISVDQLEFLFQLFLVSYGHWWILFSYATFSLILFLTLLDFYILLWQVQESIVEFFCYTFSFLIFIYLFSRIIFLCCTTPLGNLILQELHLWINIVVGMKLYRRSFVTVFQEILSTAGFPILYLLLQLPCFFIIFFLISNSLSCCISSYIHTFG